MMNKNKKALTHQNRLHRQCQNTSQFLTVKRRPQFVFYVSNLLHLLMQSTESHLKIVLLRFTIRFKTKMDLEK